MILKKSSFIQPIIRSSIPFLVGFGSYILKGALLHAFRITSKQNLSGFLNSPEVQPGSGNELHDDNFVVGLLAIVSEVSFGIYSNYLAFLFVMLLIEIISRMMKIGSKLSNASLTIGDIKSEEGMKRLKKILTKIVFYTLIFIVCFAAHRCILNVASTEVHLNLMEKGEMIHQDASLRFPRALEEEKAETIVSTPIPTLSSKSEKASLSMGNIVSSLNLDVNGLVLSKDRRFAFVTLDFYGTLKIIDITDIEFPRVVSSLTLNSSGYSFRIKTMTLSKDEKIVYISNSRDLEIIDVTDVESPKLVSFTASEIFDDEIWGASRYFRTSLVLDENTKTLYIGGLGLQIYDVSNPKKPVLLKAFENDKFETVFGSEVFQRNEICMSSDGQVLFHVNGTFEIFNISNSQDMKQISSLQTRSSVYALYLSKDSSKIFLLGTSEKREMVLEEVDISDYNSPSIKASFKLGQQSSLSPRILAVSPGESKFYIFQDEDYQGFELVVYDSVKRKTIKNEKVLIDKIQTMVFSEDGKTLMTGSNNQFLIIDMFLDYPNSEIFGSSNNVISTFSLEYKFSQTELSQDGQTLFTIRTDPENDQSPGGSIFEIWDMQAINTPKILSKVVCRSQVSHIRFLNNENAVYLFSQRAIMVLDISNKSSPIQKLSFKKDNKADEITEVVISSDEKVGYAGRYSESGVHLISFDVAELSKNKIEELARLDKKFTLYNYRVVLKDESTLIVLDQEITIYDVSNPKLFVEIASIPFGVNEPIPFINSYALSTDKKTLFVETFDQNEFIKLRIYDISVRNKPCFISEMAFSKFNCLSIFKPGFSLSSDMKSGFIFQEGSLVRIDLTDLKQPRISGKICLSEDLDEKILSYKFSTDGKKIFVLIEDKEIRILDGNIKHSLYLKKEKFGLGEKYSDDVSMLALSETSDYNLMDKKSYKIIKLSLLEMKVAPNKYALDMISSMLPTWMTFDDQNNILSIEPKKQRDLGMYTLLSTISQKIPLDAFDNLGTKESPLDSEDLFAWLVSLDYVDKKFFLTEYFGSFDTFILPSQFRAYKKEIYNIMKEFHVETCTGFEIIPSLGLKDLNNRLEVSTLSPNEVKVDIKLNPETGSEALFLNKPYASLLPTIKDGKSKLSLEGTLKEINAAIETLVVDFSQDKSAQDCNATISMFDGLNPSLTMKIVNVSKYFKENKPPKLNQMVQSQINSIIIETGQYFSIYFKDATFIDEHSNTSLTYEIEGPTNHTAVPNWISLNELTLRGTPPEEILGREVDLVLVAKNEFKQFRVPFRLHVKMSSTFLLKILMKCSPYILTFFGLLMSMNKIINIIRKGNYKHPKEYMVGPGDEISSEVIFPILFIKEDQRQSQLIMRFMRQKVENFTDDRVLNKQKIIESLSEAVRMLSVEEREKIKSMDIIEQIVINKFIDLQLNSLREEKTKSFFEELKLDCLDVVDKDQHSAGFIVNQSKLDKLIQSGRRLSKGDSVSRGALGERLMNNQNSSSNSIPEEVNMELLRDAIAAFTFKNHTLDVSPVDVDVIVKQKVPRGSFMKFLKMDLMPISFNDKNRIDYGINYKIHGEKLCFYGNVDNSFQDKTLVVQVMNIRHKILKEIWIHGVSRGNIDNEKYFVGNEKEMRGQGYEVY